LRFDAKQIKNQLLPTFRNDYAGRIGQPDTWAQRLVDACRSALGAVLPLSDAEREFLNRHLPNRNINPAKAGLTILNAKAIKSSPINKMTIAGIQYSS